MGRTRRIPLLAGGGALIVLLIGLFLFGRGNVHENEFAAIDAAHLSDGVFTALWKQPTEKRVRLTVQTEGGEQYRYDLDGGGTADVFPLTEGGGDYTVTVYEQTEGTRYLPRLTATLTLAPSDADRPFLRPNQRVPYNEKAPAAVLARELTDGLDTDAERSDALVAYITETMEYDTEWAQSLQSGYIPDLAAVLARGGGNCLDLATLLCAMLRAEGIPCKLAVGYAGQVYHAWVSVYIDNAWQHRDPTFLRSDPAFADDPNNYRAVYYY